MRPHPVTTQISIDRHSIEGILVNITASYTPSAGSDPGDEALVEDVKATSAELVTTEGETLEGENAEVVIYSKGQPIDLTEDEIEQAEQKITAERA